MNVSTHSPSRLRTYVLKLLPFVFYGLLLFFLALYLAKIDYSRLSNISFDWTAIAIASVFGLAVRYWGAYIWVNLLGHLSQHKIPHYRKLFSIYAQSWLARYIPGTAPSLASRVYFASKLGISKNKLAVSTLLEVGLQVTVVIAVALTLLLIDPRFNLIDTEQRLLMIAVLVGCCTALIPYVFNRIVSIVYRLVKRKKFPQEHYIGPSAVIRGTTLYMIWSLVGGVSLFFMSKGVYPELGYENILFVMGVSNLAGALGMLAFFAPSGIGVREGVLIVLLSIVIPIEFAVVVAVFTRLWGLVLDVGFLISARLYASSY